jgi:hypothetical protein
MAGNHGRTRVELMARLSAPPPNRTGTVAHLASLSLPLPFLSFPAAGREAWFCCLDRSARKNFPAVRLGAARTVADLAIHQRDRLSYDQRQRDAVLKICERCGRAFFFVNPTAPVCADRRES